MSALPLPQNIDKIREFWATVAKKNDWHTEPFFVQVWINKSGEITDSVSYPGLDRDYVLNEDDSPVLLENS